MNIHYHEASGRCAEANHSFEQEVKEMIQGFSGKTLTLGGINAYREQKKQVPYTPKEQLILMSFLKKSRYVSISYTQTSAEHVITLIKFLKEPSQVVLH